MHSGNFRESGCGAETHGCASNSDAGEQADTPARYTRVPFVWPSASDLGGASDTTDALTRALSFGWEGARAALLATSNLDQAGVDRLAQLLREHEGIAVWLIVAVYPTCATRHSDLDLLNEMQQLFHGRLKVRLLPKRWDEYPSANLLLLKGKEAGRPLLRFGTTPNAECARPLAVWHANLVFYPDPILAEETARWFDAAWGQGAPLTRRTACIPHLVPARGTDEGSRLWAEFLAECERARTPSSGTDDKGAQASFDLGAEADDAETAGETPSTSEEPSEAFGLPKADPLAVRILALVAEGAIASVVKATRAKPLDVPVSARLFGVSPQETHGRVMLERAFRVSVLSAEDLAQIEKHRNRIGSLIAKFSAPLADGMRWMPHSARALFEKTRAEHDQKGVAALKAILGSNPEAFVDAERERLRANADAALQAATGSKRVVTDEQFEQIMDSLKERLAAAVNADRLLPQVIYFEGGNLTFGDTEEGRAAWQQAFSLVYELAMKQREALVGKHFWRDFLPAEERDAYREAMDVWNDCARRSDGRDGWIESEIDLLKDIRASDAMQPREKCEAVFEIIDGKRSAASDRLWDAERKRMEEGRP